MYSSESAFSSALLNALKAKAKRLLIQRIESGETARGIPDLYLRNNKREYWIELKNIHQLVNSTAWKIPWRPGQQTWASQYKRYSGNYTYTIAALQDGYIIIPMNNMYKDNIVYRQQCIRMTKLGDVVNCILGGLENVS
jgi:hypothetical protein